MWRKVQLASKSADHGRWVVGPASLIGVRDGGKALRKRMQRPVT